MFISILKVTLFIPGSQNLKDKRRVLKRIKDKMKNKFNVSIAEVDDMDLWQKSTMGIAVVGNDMAFTESMIDSILHFIRMENDCEIINERKETISVGNFA